LNELKRHWKVYTEERRKKLKEKTMPRIRPKFTKSPYFVDEPGNWHLKPGAPKELQEELDQYLSSLGDVDEPGTINGVHIDYPY
jgi:hypothetical protein